jgi:hypothetical protein
VVKLYYQVRDQGVKGGQAKFERIRKELAGEIGGRLNKTGDLIELQNRLKKEGLLPKSKKSDPTNLGDIFARQIEAGRKERAPSPPPDLRAQLGALPAPRQLERSPGAITKTPPAVRRELAGIVESVKKGSMDLMMDDISRLMRGETPQNIEIASDRGELGMKARMKPSGQLSGSATGNTRWARGDAEDFDGAFKIYKRIRGDSEKEDWTESSKKGTKVGEGAFGTVLTAGPNKMHKRGEIGEFEADVLKKVGDKDLGPKLILAEIATQKRQEYGLGIQDGRISMSKVKGEPIGAKSGPSKEIGGKKVADIYWKAMADLHRMGIAHNDAHIDNILVDDKGKGRWVDFGLAQPSPKAALAEAMGIFNTLPGTTATRLPGAYGQGNWQTRRWDGTGVRQAEAARKAGGEKWKEFMERFPIASRVWENRGDAQFKLLKMGLSKDDVSTIIDHGIRSTPESYTKGPWAKLTDKQAQEVLDILYDGI